MTIIGNAFSKSPIKAEKILAGPTKFQLMLAIFDGNHTEIHPRLYAFKILRQNGQSESYYSHSFQAHLYGATFVAPYWILEGVDGYWGMSGLVKNHSFIAQYNSEKKKGYIKYLD